MGGVYSSSWVVCIKETCHIPFQRQGIEKGTNKDFNVKKLSIVSGHLSRGPKWLKASQVVLVVKNLPANAGNVKDARSIPGSGRFPGGEYMATHPSVPAWRIPWTEESGGLWSVGWQRIGHDWSNSACMHACRWLKKRWLIGYNWYLCEYHFCLFSYY